MRHIDRNVHVIFIFRDLTVETLTAHIKKFLNNDESVPVKTDDDGAGILQTSYTGPDDWPMSMTVPCWNCDVCRDVTPAFIPMNPSTSKKTGQLKCTPRGQFCSWPCAARYINTEMSELSSNERQTLAALLCIFEEDFSGSRKMHIPIAPPRTIMKRYSGNGITEDEYFEYVQRLMADHVMMSNTYGAK